MLIKDHAFTDVAVFGMSEPDVALALAQPWVSVDNDSQGTSPDRPARPRASASARLRHVPAHPPEVRPRRAAAHARGGDSQVHARCRRSGCGWPIAASSRQGMWADIVVFDPGQIRDKATFENPNQLSVGMEYVLVNGVPVIADGKATNALPGKVLRGASATSAGSTK